MTAPLVAGVGAQIRIQGPHVPNDLAVIIF